MTRLMSAALAVLLIGWSFYPTTARAGTQTMCGDRSDVVASLKKGYSEVPISMGLANNGSVVEVFASFNGETWTIVMTQPSGISCLMAAGEGWENLPKNVKDPKI